MKKIVYLNFMNILCGAVCFAQSWVDPKLKDGGYTPRMKVRTILEKSTDSSDFLLINVKYDEEYNLKIQEKMQMANPGYSIHFSPITKSKNMKVKLLFGDQPEIQIGVNDNMTLLYQTQFYIKRLSESEKVEVRSLVDKGKPVIEIMSMEAKVREYKEKSELVASVGCGQIFRQEVSDMNSVIDDYYDWRSKSKMEGSLSDSVKSCMSIKSSDKINSAEELFDSNKVRATLIAESNYKIFKHWKGYEDTPQELPYVLCSEVIQIGN